MPSSIFRKETPAEAELARRQRELAAARKKLQARESELHDLRGHLISFEGRYLRQVGLLLRELDSWERRIAEFDLEVNPIREDETAPELAVEAPKASRKPTHKVSVRALYRELAKRIHPDFADDEQDAQRRTRLMAQANDALRRRDAGILQRMLDGFDAEEDLVRDVEAETAHVLHLIDVVGHDLEAIERDVETLTHSDSAQLQDRTLAAAREGRDLLAEMARQVSAQIGIAMSRYERAQYRAKNPPKGPSVEEIISVEIPSLRRRFAK